jgi:hypothetical protein
VVKVDLERQLVAVIRVQAGPLQVAAFAFTDFNRLEDADEALGRLLQLNASALQQVDKRSRRAIQNGTSSAVMSM